eukprot:gnl/MRDRNA2_/MRDRNA2_93011_c0_seq1.p1 gnl/MRDRNA2_/MRDRNA2_93011_c0~~gnl/MRDRNA2_/MRDRNA2_93011_c0_seq1.p1  ORF type:complete len:934 (+),score=228.13 gnl/MRDRNA2_/MRDRNA2_93011_c0_seq1:54-2855(+)
MNSGAIIRLDPYVAHILGLCCADSLECEDPFAITAKTPVKDLLGQGGETFSVLQTGKAGGFSPYRMATWLPLTHKQRQVAYTCHARQDVAECPEEEVAFSKCGTVNFAHPPCLTVRSAAGEDVRLTIGDWAADLSATNWIEEACKALAEHSRKTDLEILASGASIVDFEILVPKAQVAFLQPGIISATSLRNALQPLPGYAGPALIDILSESPLYVSEALIGAKLVGTVKHGGVPELLIPRSDGLQPVSLDGNADLSGHGSLLKREFGGWLNEAIEHPECWSLLSVRVESSDVLLDLLDPPQWPLAPPRVVLAAKCHFRLGPLHPCPAPGDIHALIDFASGALADIGKALSIDSRLLCFAAVEPDGPGSLVEVVFLADEEDVQKQIDMVAANQEGASHSVVEEGTAPLQIFFKFAHMVRNGDFANKEEFSYLKDVDKTFMPRLTQRLVYNDLEEIISIWEDVGLGLTNNWDSKVVQPLQQHYSQKDLYTFFERRRKAEKNLRLAIDDQKRDEENLARCIAQAKEAEVAAETIQEAEEKLEQWSRLRVMLAAQAELDAAEAAKDAPRLTAAIDRAREQGVDEPRIQKAERELARILAAERLTKAMETASSEDVGELRAAIEGARAAGVDSDLIRRAIAQLKKLEAEEVLKRRRVMCENRLLEDMNDVVSFLDSLVAWIHSAAVEMKNGGEIPASPTEEWFRSDGITMLQASIKEAGAAQVEQDHITKGEVLITTWANTWQLTTALQEAKTGSIDRLAKSIAIAKPSLEGNEKGEAMIEQLMGLMEHWQEEHRQRTREQFMNAQKVADVASMQRILSSSDPEEMDAMVNLRDTEGLTPWLLGGNFGNLGMMQLLLEYGCDAEAEDPNSNNALDICVDKLLEGAAPKFFSKPATPSTGMDAEEDAAGENGTATNAEATSAQADGGGGGGGEGCEGG